MMHGGMMQCPFGAGDMWGMALFMALGGLLTLILIGVVIYIVAHRLRQDDAVMVLRRRLAQGEIDETEYHKRLAQLK